MVQSTRTAKRQRRKAPAAYRADGAYRPQHFHFDRRIRDIIEKLDRLPGDEDLSSKQVAALLGVSLQWVEINRGRGVGPGAARHSPRCVKYTRASVRRFLQARLKIEQERAEQRKIEAVRADVNLVRS